jgi:S-methylmethionine-dependent homocysteine/selenocysteine methylase
MSTQGIIILDGGMGRELERIGAPFSQPFWSAQALMEAPEKVAEAHRNFIKAGAQVITTNSYAVVPTHIGDDLFKEKSKELISLSAQLAKQEADVSSHPVQVAGCIPPVFGSYQPEKFNAETVQDILYPFFKEQEPFIDLFLAETISSTEEVFSIVDAYNKFGSKKPLWVSFTLQEFYGEDKPPQLRSGEILSEVLPDILKKVPAQAILFNCCPVEDISPALEVCRNALGEQSNIMLGGYANAFGKQEEQRSPTGEVSCLRQDITPESYLRFAQKWVQQGAKIVGGCCGIGPEHIAALADNIKHT